MFDIYCSSHRVNGDLILSKIDTRSKTIESFNGFHSFPIKNECENDLDFAYSLDFKLNKN